MSHHLLSTNEAAQQLGISRATMYQWLADSDVGALVIRGQSVTIDYLQGGAKGGLLKMLLSGLFGEDMY
jgi:excisionase family DNA binding protein